MRQGRQLLILWDFSHIWGLMAWRASRALGIPCRLVKALEISQAGLLGKAKGGAGNGHVLLVPGGSARLKAMALGASGLESIRSWVRAGGSYIGFCGGAGLALSGAAPHASLGICPWSRRPYASRRQHQISGLVRVFIEGVGNSPFAFQGHETAGHDRCLPVWWPGRFAWDADERVHVLARYDEPMPDLWCGDAPIGQAPDGIVHLRDEPVLVHGKAGTGNYILSYAHLESPSSRFANRWLALIFESFGLVGNGSRLVPEWETVGDNARNIHPADLASFDEAFRRVIAIGEKEKFFTRRRPWLLGWRAGMPGAVCNNLIAALATLSTLGQNERAEAYWLKNRDAFLRLGDLFLRNAENYFRAAAGKQPTRSPGRMQHEIFGSPMAGGGLAGRVLRILEELIWIGSP